MQPCSYFRKKTLAPQGAESNAVKGLFCHFGWHRWRQLDLRELVPDKEVHFCFWCSKVRVDGVTYDG
jgi:hypothetical protein